VKLWIAVLQWLMSSKVELVQGCDRSELAEVCQQSYVRVMGHNIHRQGEDNVGGCRRVQ